MGRIAVLDRQTIDRIAAGEVVERPASVVKELVENAVDAGASQVTVEIREGGVGYIRVTDNGSGIGKEDIELAFLRHSTSKIRTAEDLSGVRSLGFRGEALSSISAVSMVELITKTRDAVTGNRCCLEGGVQKGLEEIGAPDGTTMIVRNLFYNTPARKKFLKAEMTEAAAVHELMTHLALSHPEISFKVLIHHQMKLQTPGNGNLKDVIYHVYGREIALRLVETEREEGPLRISGFLGKPEISRGNRNYENYFVNGRFVKSKLIAGGIEDGYKAFLMQHRYPFVCLNIEMDGKLLDVNVHPAKMELRFSNRNLVYETLRRTVGDALSGRELIPEVNLSGAEKEAPKTERPAAPAGPSAPREPETKPPLERLWKTPGPTEGSVEPRDNNLEYFMAEMKKRVTERHEWQPSAVREENGYQAERRESGPAMHAEPQQPPKPETDAPAEQMNLFDGKLLSKEAAVRHVIIGQLFGTYWLVQYAEKLYIIDQHAAHEKVLYERLMKRLDGRSFQAQLLSPPIVLNFSMQEEQLFLKYRQSFADMGFEIEEFGDRAYAVRAVPADLPGLGGESALTELIDSLSDLPPSGGVGSDSLLHRAAAMSCRAAVKGNQRMSVREAEALIGELLTLENPYHCPHGRPTIISMTKRELEKKFKRIV